MHSLINTLSKNELFAYPTEGICGLGGYSYNEEVAKALSSLKKRPPTQPLICITSIEKHILEWIDFAKLTHLQKRFYDEHKHNFITFLLPASANVPEHCIFQGKVALRVTDHPVINKICNHFSAPIFSTSVNISGQPPLVTSAAIKQTFPNLKIIEGQLGGEKKPSALYDLEKDLWLRR